VKHRTRTLVVPVAALALSLSIAACGSDDDASSETTTATQATTETTTPMEGTTAMEGTTGMDAAMPGGEATVGDITVSGVWMREPAEGQTRTAAYGTITNNGDTDVTLVAASVPFDVTVEIHETITGDDGTMQMQEVPEGFVVPAGGSFALEPGGPHIMLIDIDPADIVGTIDVTMIFDDGTEVTVGAPVKALDMADSGDMGSDMTATTMAG
jgi:periplasmic copper chaperone A